MQNTSGKIDYKKMPNNLEAEQSVLGCVLIDNDISANVISELQEEDFYSESNKIIFGIMRTLVLKRKPIDSVTLSSELEYNGVFAQVGGISYITQLMDIVPSSVRYKHYVEIVKNTSTMRKLIRSAQEIIDNSYKSDDRESALDYAQKVIFDISDKVQSSALTSIDESFKEALTMFEELEKHDSKYKGTKTGLKELDRVLNGGLHKSDLIVLAARPGVGKTSLALNIVQYIGVEVGGVCAVFSLEMSKLQLAQRIICGRSNVSMQDAYRGNLTNKQWERLFLQESKIKDAKIFVDDSSLVTPPEILAKCRSLKMREKRLDVVMVDYIQLMSGGGKRYDSRQQEVSEISRNMKIIAKELNVPVIALSQLSRAVTGRKDQRPVLSDLRESGAIEQDADIVMFIHRPDMVEDNASAEKDVAELIIAKHRAGSQDFIKLRWNGAITSFTDYDEKPKPQAQTAEGELVKISDGAEKIFNDNGGENVEVPAEQLDGGVVLEIDDDTISNTF